ncbi:PH domain-containing protein [Microbacterium oleivorans]|uniref:PH domain-containing protein n=1 Tax=Microbacterium TaxID=33882 RepID=UPI00204203FD|nr:PH domain-containing protein [Microbacterium oleivorans]MCM3695217.1 PH domain-containing protein [Microbacterium oleivorans]
MTTSPDPTNPITDSPTPTDDATFSTILEPRGAHRLPLGDGQWRQLSRKYVLGQVIGNLVLLVLLVAAVLTLWLMFQATWPFIPGGILFAIVLVTLIVTPRQARSIGYQLRQDDLVFRRGILWQRLVSVPYGRLQLVDITHGPLDRMLGIAQLKLVTAAASTGVTIPGLPQKDAEALRDTLIEVAETRRTGL